MIEASIAQHFCLHVRGVLPGPLSTVINSHKISETIFNCIPLHNILLKPLKLFSFLIKEYIQLIIFNLMIISEISIVELKLLSSQVSYIVPLLAEYVYQGHACAC